MTASSKKSPIPASRRSMLASLSLCVALSVPGITWGAPGQDAALDASIAERLALIGDESVADEGDNEALLRQASSLLGLARKYNPKELRFARSHADVLLRLGDRNAALEALTAVRTLAPKDQVAMIQFVDLNADRMETAEAKVAYLEQVVNAPSVSAEVRSHAAVTLTDLYFQRSQDTHATAMLDKALQLNPQNIAALLMRYRLAGSSRAGVDRVRALIAVIYASPGDPSHLISLSQECVAAGDYENARAFYDLGLQVLYGHRQAPPVEDIIDIVGSELLRGDANEIAPLLIQAIEAIKVDGRLYTLGLLVDQFNGGDPEVRKISTAAARGVYLAQLAGVSQLLNTPDVKEMPTTNPAVPMPDVAADVAKLVAGDPQQLRVAYTVALAEQIWFDLYFRAAPVEDATINALGALVGMSDPAVVRFQGWKLLSSGQADEAKLKLSAVADRDGYAKLGVAAAEMMQGNDEQARIVLTELLAERPTGMLSAFVGAAAKRQAVTVPMSAQEQQIAELATPVRRVVLESLMNPRSAYHLSATPLSVSFGWGEPALVRVTLRNNGRVPVTIGPGAFIEPTFAVDVQIRGDANGRVPAAAIGRWTGATRLMPRDSISQVVRIDRGFANLTFKQYPTPSFGVSALVTTNANIAQSGTTAGVGGQQTGVSSAMERRAAPFHVEAFRAQLIDRIAKGSAVDRLNAMDLSANVLPLLLNQQGNEDARRVADQFRSAIQTQLAAETSEEVKAWVIGFNGVAFGFGASPLDTSKQLIAEDSELAKVLGLVRGRTMSASERQELVDLAMAQQPTGVVLEMARGLAIQGDLVPPTTQPATLTPPDASAPMR